VCVLLDFRMYTFLDLCETQNFTKTAGNLHITQPAVTQHLKFLESYYNVKLYVYEGHHFSLTSEGQYLHNQVVIISKETEMLKNQIQKMYSENAKKIIIGADPAIGNNVLPQLIASYSLVHPDVSFSVSVNNADILLEQLKNGRLSSIITDQYTGANDLNRVPFYVQPVLCVCAPSHHFAGKTVGFDDLKQETIIIQETDSHGYYCTKSILEENQQEIEAFHSHIEMGSFVSLINLLRYNLGVTFAYHCNVAKELASGELSQIYIRNFNSVVQFSLVTLGHLQINKATACFLEFCHEKLQ